MISWILGQQQALSFVLAEDRKNWHRMPTDTQLSVLETVNDILEPLSCSHWGKACHCISSQSSLKQIQKELIEIENATSLAKILIETIHSDLGRRYSNSGVCEILGLASFLDPRFKEQHLFGKEISHL